MFYNDFPPVKRDGLLDMNLIIGDISVVGSHEVMRSCIGEVLLTVDTYEYSFGLYLSVTDIIKYIPIIRL